MKCRKIGFKYITSIQYIILGYLLVKNCYVSLFWYLYNNYNVIFNINFLLIPWQNLLIINTNIIRNVAYCVNKVFMKIFRQGGSLRLFHIKKILSIIQVNLVLNFILKLV